MEVHVCQGVDHWELSYNSSRTGITHTTTALLLPFCPPLTSFVNYLNFLKMLSLCRDDGTVDKVGGPGSDPQHSRET